MVNFETYFENIRDVIAVELNNAKKSIQVVMAYFTDSSLFDILCKKLEDNVKVELLLSNNNWNLVDNKLDFNRFIQFGGQLYLSQSDNIHHKICVIDSEVLIKGSYNWTYNAKNKNENIDVIRDKQVIDRHLNEIEKIKQQITQILNIDEFDKHRLKILNNFSEAEDIEYKVLGAIISDKNLFFTASYILKIDLFSKTINQKIYYSINILYNNPSVGIIDFSTLVEELRRNGDLELIAPNYIRGLFRNDFNTENVLYYIFIMIEYFIRRELIKLSYEIQRKANDTTQDIESLFQSIEKKFWEIRTHDLKNSTIDIDSAMTMAITELESKKDYKSGLTGVPTGFSGLDRITSGWQRSDLIIIAARPSMGKTAFSLSVLRNAAVDFGKSVAIFSLEMSTLQLVDRLISWESEIESTRLKTGQIQDGEMEQLKAGVSKIRNAKIFIHDTPSITISELELQCKKTKREHNIELIIIDYLQLIQLNKEDAKRITNREQEISSIARRLKSLTRDLDIPIIALSQLSRAVETRGGDKKPQLSDLRDSGAIEQDADIVIFLYRPEYYGITEDAEGNPTQGMAEIIISKHRSGSLGTVNLQFIGKYMKFTDPEIDSSGNNSYRSFSNTSDTPNEFDIGGVTFSSKMNRENKSSFKPPSSDEVPF